MPTIPALRRQRQVDFCEFEASLVYKVAKTTWRNHVLKQTKQNKTKQKRGRGEKQNLVLSGDSKG